MKILIIGGGGREHALAWKIANESKVTQVLVAPGNAGTQTENNVRNVNIAVDDIDALVQLAKNEQIHLTIVGPEVPLVLGIVDTFNKHSLRIFGPSAKAAQLEGSKIFSKSFLTRHNIPTAAYKKFTNSNEAVDYIQNQTMPIVIKADGLAAGKGVIIAQDINTAINAVNDMLEQNKFGDAGAKIVVEDFLSGVEASFMVMSDGKNALPMATSQDHKAVFNGDIGANTGGMGAYSPAPVIDQAVFDSVMANIIQPTIDGMAHDGMPFVGFLYAGLMIDANKNIKVLEFNARLGDPETQPIMTRLKSDLVELCDAALDGKIANAKATWDSQSALGVVLAARGYPFEYPEGDVITLPEVENSDCKIFHAGTSLKNNQLKSAGGRVMCVCALGKSIQSAQKKAYAQVKKIHFKHIYYRDDIGYKAIN